jgi:small conductance mechanosensitive channel
LAGLFDFGITVQFAIVVDILQVVIILILTYLVTRIFRVVVRRAGGQVPSGLVASLQQIGSWAIWIIGIIVILSQLQVNTNILLLILGLGGLAVIVAYQGILGDIGAAQFISNYQAFKVGEWIQVNRYYGRVIERNLIHTKILTPNNEVVVVPNSLLLKNSVVNRTRSGGLRVQIPVFVRPGTDLKGTQEKLLGIGEEMKVDLFPDSSPVVRIREMSREGVTLVLLLQIVNPAKKDQIISDVNQRIYELMPEIEGWKQSSS